MSDYMLKPQALERLIYQAAHDFNCNTGKLPTYLYLGHDEFYTWRKIIELYTVFTAVRGEGGLEWNGMQVIEVNLKTHIGVGIL